MQIIIWTAIWILIQTIIWMYWQPWPLPPQQALSSPLPPGSVFMCVYECVHICVYVVCVRAWVRACVYVCACVLHWGRWASTLKKKTKKKSSQGCQCWGRWVSTLCWCKRPAASRRSRRKPTTRARRSPLLATVQQENVCVCVLCVYTHTLAVGPKGPSKLLATEQYSSSRLS